MNLVTLGTLALDSIETPFGKVDDVLGGSATYFSLAANFFSDCGIIGVVGDDFPDEHIEFLKSRKIDISGVEKTDGKTFRWEGYYEYDMNQAHTLKTELNVLETFKPKIPKSYKRCNFLFLANIDPDIQLQVLREIKPKHSLCDTMNFWIEHKREELTELLKHIDAVVINDGEAREYCKTPNLIKAGRMLLKKGPDKVIVKKGEHGALLFSNDAFFSVPGYPCEEVIDPTGAGDSFAGGTVGYLSRINSLDDEHIKRAMVYGSVVASHVVEDFSVNSMKRLDGKSIKVRYDKFKEIVAFDHSF